CAVTNLGCTGGPVAGWIQHDLCFTEQASNTITFRGRDDPSYLGLDNVSINAASASAPEPSARWVLPALLGLAAWRKVTAWPAIAPGRA
ncbi:MAG TPA: hypothetical protein VGO93_19870, partial [Candidatus Xenobia bacterium]